MIDKVIAWLGAALLYAISTFIFWKLGNWNGISSQKLKQAESDKKVIQDAINEINNINSNIDELHDRFE